MPIYKYQAFDNSGGKVDDFLEALTPDEALEIIKSKGLLPISVVEDTKLQIKKSRVALNLKQLEFFTHELSLLLNAGLRVDKGITLLQRNRADPALSFVLEKIMSELNAGIPLGDAFRSQSNFDELYCNLVDIGEATGRLPYVFSKLAENLAFKRELQSKLISAITYPSAIFVVCILAVLFIFNFVVPRMMVMFEGIAVLPWYTQLIISISKWLQNYQLILFFVLTSSILVIVRQKNHPRIKQWLNDFGLSVPIVKSIVLSGDRIRYNSSLAMMLEAGVSLDCSMQLASKSIINDKLRHQMDIARQKVNSGERLSLSLAQTKIFPPFYVSLLEVGEETSELAKVFNEIAQRSRREFEEWSQKTTSLIEPLMIVFMGLIVGGVVVVMLLSMVSINEIGL